MTSSGRKWEVQAERDTYCTVLYLQKGGGDTVGCGSDVAFVCILYIVSVSIRICVSLTLCMDMCINVPCNPDMICITFTKRRCQTFCVSGFLNVRICCLL